MFSPNPQLLDPQNYAVLVVEAQPSQAGILEREGSKGGSSTPDLLFLAFLVRVCAVFHCVPFEQNFKQTERSSGGN